MNEDHSKEWNTIGKIALYVVIGSGGAILWAAIMDFGLGLESSKEYAPIIKMAYKIGTCGLLLSQILVIWDMILEKFSTKEN